MRSSRPLTSAFVSWRPAAAGTASTPLSFISNLILRDGELLGRRLDLVGPCRSGRLRAVQLGCSSGLDGCRQILNGAGPGSDCPARGSRKRWLMTICVLMRDKNLRRPQIVEFLRGLSLFPGGEAH